MISAAVGYVITALALALMAYAVGTGNKLVASLAQVGQLQVRFNRTTQIFRFSDFAFLLRFIQS